MTEYTPNQRVYVKKSLLDVSVCDFATDIAGKEAFVTEFYPEDDEAFVVSEIGKEYGTFVPFEYIEDLKD